MPAAGSTTLRRPFAMAAGKEAQRAAKSPRVERKAAVPETVLERPEQVAGAVGWQWAPAARRAGSLIAAPIATPIRRQLIGRAAALGTALRRKQAARGLGGWRRLPVTSGKTKRWLFVSVFATASGDRPIGRQRAAAGL
jgi:hypothetical protein